MVKQLWPNVNQFVRELVRDKIQPIIHEKLNKKNLKGFKFETISLGSVVSIQKMYSFMVFDNLTNFGRSNDLTAYSNWRGQSLR